MGRARPRRGGPHVFAVSNPTGDGSFPWWMVGVVKAVVIVAVLLLVVRKRR